MTNGEKLLSIRRNISEYCMNLFVQTGVDAGLGALIIDAVRADMYQAAFHGMASRQTKEEARKDKAESEEGETT